MRSALRVVVLSYDMPLLEEKIPLVSHYGQVVQYTEGGLQIKPLRYGE